MLNEIWVDIIGFEKEYQISNYGNVKNKKRNTLRKPYNNNAGKGYLYIDLYKGHIRVKKESIHRLIAKHFIDNPKNKCHINHKDGNTMNNKISNLEWTTPLENAIHAIDTGLRKTTFINYKYEIIRDYKKGHTLSYLSKKYFGDKSSIKNLLIRNNINLRKFNEYTKSGYEKYELKMDIMFGASLDELVVKYPISKKTIRNFIYRYLGNFKNHNKFSKGRSK